MEYNTGIVQPNPKKNQNLSKKKIKKIKTLSPPSHDEPIYLK